MNLYETYLVMAAIIIAVVGVYANYKGIIQWLDRTFFAMEGRLRSEYICPRCGSPDWKFPNPLKMSENIPVNFIQLVNSLFECRNCGNIGTFFAVDDASQAHLKPKLKKEEITKSPTLSGFLGRICGFLAIIFCFIILGDFFGFMVVREVLLRKEKARQAALERHTLRSIRRQ